MRNGSPEIESMHQQKFESSRKCPDRMKTVGSVLGNVKHYPWEKDRQVLKCNSPQYAIEVLMVCLSISPVRNGFSICTLNLAHRDDKSTGLKFKVLRN